MPVGAAKEWFESRVRGGPVGPQEADTIDWDSRKPGMTKHLEKARNEEQEHINVQRQMKESMRTYKEDEQKRHNHDDKEKGSGSKDVHGVNQGFSCTRIGQFRRSREPEVGPRGHFQRVPT